MTEFETQILAGQQILIRQIGQIAIDVRDLKLRAAEQAKAAATFPSQVGEVRRTSE
jgi:hypothetical protein